MDRTEDLYAANLLVGLRNQYPQRPVEGKLSWPSRADTHSQITEYEASEELSFSSPRSTPEWARYTDDVKPNEPDEHIFDYEEVDPAGQGQEEEADEEEESEEEVVVVDENKVGVGSLARTLPMTQQPQTGQ